MTQQTALHDAHLRLGARMVDFAGWQMPLHFGSQIEEHHAVRHDCGMFDVSHMCIVDFAGDDAKAFLLRLLANNVARLRQPGKALYSVMLNENGGVVDDLIVYGQDEMHFRAVLNAATAKTDQVWMAEQLAEWRMNLAITARRDLALVAVQGPNARLRVWETLPGLRAVSESMKPFFAIQFGGLFVARTGYTGEDGFELSLPVEQAPALWQALIDAKVRPCGLGARDTLRLEAGMNLYGQDMDETISPLDAGLGWSVDQTTERDFVGKAALQARGQQSRFLGLVLQDRGVLRARQRVVTAQGDGVVTSGTFSPTLQKSIALARLPLEVRAGNTVEVEIRDKLHAARVVKPPFVRNGKILIDLETTT